jgi:hypothetical protein
MAIFFRWSFNGTASERRLKSNWYWPLSYEILALFVFGSAPAGPIIGLSARVRNRQDLNEVRMNFIDNKVWKTG